MAVRNTITEVEQGDAFRVARGSRAGSLGVSGSVEVAHLEGSSAQLVVSVGKFGLNMTVQLDLERDGDTVDVTASGDSFETLSFSTKVVTETPTEVRLEEVTGKLADPHLVLDGAGGATLDAQIPKIGKIHFVIEPK